MDRLLIIGTSGLAREFTTWFCDGLEVVGYAGADPHAASGLGGRAFRDGVTPAEAGTDRAVVAVGDPALKARLHALYAERGFRFPTFVHPSAVVAPGAVLGEGVVISPQCVVSPGVRMGRLAYLNFCSSVGHDAEVGDFVEINPGSHLGGFSVIGAGTLVGSGATILDKVRIGSGCTVGSGSVVFGRVADGATVMGNPAKRMRAFEEG